MSSEERSLLGRWEWKIDHEGYRENGFLILNRDKTYEYKIRSCVPVECLGEETDGKPGVWVLNDNSICFATEFVSAGLFSAAHIAKKRCLFYDLSVNKDILSFKLEGFFYKNELFAKQK